MKSRNHQVIQIYEHQALKVGVAYDGVIFTTQHWEQLLRLNETQYPPFFQIIHQGIKALHYVGCIALPGLTLEILPKTDVPKNINWQVFLLEMLQACGKIPRTKTSSLLATHQGLMSDFFISAFLSEVETLCKAGLLKKYRREARNTHTFRGKILISEHIRRNVVHKERVFAEHQVYDQQHILHQILRKALISVKTLSSQPELVQRTESLLGNLPVQSAKVDWNTIKKLRLTREDAAYGQALAWAKLILQTASPQLICGSFAAPFFMIDMQQLFESYVSIQLQQAAPLLGCKLHQQPSSRFWKQRSLRPDMVLTTAEGETIILDTKWKLLKNGQPEEADLKQIYIYNQFFEAKRGILLYPKQSDLGAYSGIFLHPQNDLFSCEISFIDLIDERCFTLSNNWAIKLLKRILSKETLITF